MRRQMVTTMSNNNNSSNSYILLMIKWVTDVLPNRHHLLEISQLGKELYAAWRRVFLFAINGDRICQRA